MRFIFLISFLLLSCLLPAQEYKAMMADPQYSISEVKKAAEAYFQKHGRDEGSGFKGYQRWLWANAYKYNQNGERSTVDPYFVAWQWQQVQEHMSVASSAQWTDLGPYSIDSITGHYSPGLGRVECFYVDTSDQDFLYLGSRSGGFWKSTDGGQNWTSSTTDFLPATGVNTMTVSPTNRDSILINLRNARNGTSHGIYRSVDGGQTWLQTAFNPANVSWTGLGKNGQVYQLAYHPEIPDRVYLGTNEGLYISHDNLNSWTRVLNSANITHIQFHPTDTATLYVYDDYYWGSNGNVVLVSHDGGKTFSSSATLNGNNGSNVEIAVSPACPDCLYAASGNGVWKSTDQGQNFQFMSNPPRACDGFAVSDQDTSIMIYGMLDIYRSNDGGKNFSQVANWFINGSFPFNGPQYVHADLREIRSINGEFFIGTDGYLAKSSSQGQSWQRLSKGTGIRENYSIGIAQSDPYTTVAGSQDNGTSLYRSEGWVEFYGADGMEGLVHPLHSRWLMGSVQFGSRRLSFDAGSSQQSATPSGQSGSWEAPLERSSTDHFKLYHFGDQVYSSDQFGLNWVLRGSPNFSGEIIRAAVGPNNGEILAVSRQDDFEISLNGGQSFRRRSTGLPNATITDIAFAPHNDSIIIVTYGSYQNDNSKVFISYDQGITWNNITANLGNMPIRSVVMDDSPDHVIYLGAEIGVYAKGLSESSWTLYNKDLPNMSVTDLEIMHGANLLRAATWGRGMWETPLRGRADFPQIQTTAISAPPTFLVPTDAMEQYVQSKVVYAQNLDTVYLRWSDQDLSLDSVIGMVPTGGEYRSIQPIPAFPQGTDIYFKVYAVGANQDTSATYRFHYRVQDVGYCKSGFDGSNPSHYISKVDLPGLSQSSGRSGYTDFTHLTGTVASSQSYGITVRTQGTSSGDSVYAWVDYNSDETFDITEIVSFNPIDPFGEARAQLLIPQFSGDDTVRIRIRILEGGQPLDPCNYYQGETEDYSLVIKGDGIGLDESRPMVLRVYPNPAEDRLKFELGGGESGQRYRIINLQGQVIEEEILNPDQKGLSLQKLSNGSYFLELQSEDGQWYRAPFMKS